MRLERSQFFQSNNTADDCTVESLTEFLLECNINVVIVTRHTAKTRFAGTTAFRVCIAAADRQYCY